MPQTPTYSADITAELAAIKAQSKARDDTFHNFQAETRNNLSALREHIDSSLASISNKLDVMATSSRPNVLGTLGVVGTFGSLALAVTIAIGSLWKAGVDERHVQLADRLDKAISELRTENRDQNTSFIGRREVESHWRTDAERRQAAGDSVAEKIKRNEEAINKLRDDSWNKYQHELFARNAEDDRAEARRRLDKLEDRVFGQKGG